VNNVNCYSKNVNIYNELEIITTATIETFREKF
jgi:hypothetical protein